jgi:hypothetical protein
VRADGYIDFKLKSGNSDFQNLRIKEVKMAIQSKNVGDLFRYITEYTGNAGGIYGPSVLAYCAGAKTKDLVAQHTIDIAVKNSVQVQNLVNSLGVTNIVKTSDGIIRGRISFQRKNYSITIKNVGNESPVKKEDVVGDIEFLGWNDNGICSWSKEFSANELKNKVEREEYSTPPWAKGDSSGKLEEFGFKEVPMSKKEVKTMNNAEKPKMLEELKANLNDATYRVAGTQLTKGTKTALLAVMKKQGMDDGKLSGFSAFMETPFGDALISSILGVGIPYAPMIGDDPRAQRMAKELRTQGMTIIGNEIVGLAMSELFPLLQGAISSLPTGEEVKARVVESVPGEISSGLSDEMEKDLEEDKQAKKMQA